MVSKPWIHPGVCNVWVKVLNSNLIFKAMSKNAESHVVSTSRVARLVYFNPNCSILDYFRVVWIMIFRLDFFSLAVSLDKFKRNMENPSSLHIIIKRQAYRKKKPAKRTCLCSFRGEARSSSSSNNNNNNNHHEKNQQQ